tara:strand:- start:491 stop:832 length:342 start_codon:yes stop_codon:yes gene_type:complete
MSLANHQKWLKFNNMRFIEIILKRKFTLISIFLFLYVSLNLLDGERGLISYYKNQKVKKQLIQDMDKLNNDLILIEKKNRLLTENIDLDYLEILYREKFLVGKKNEKIFKSNN